MIAITIMVQFPITFSSGATSTPGRRISLIELLQSLLLVAASAAAARSGRRSETAAKRSSLKLGAPLYKEGGQ